MKKILFLILLFFVGLFVYFTFFSENIRQSYETFFLPFMIYLFFAMLLLMIIARGYDFMRSR
jgi:ABC-type transport system involved in multi-copper enzyme maturation permease subunit